MRWRGWAIRVGMLFGSCGGTSSLATFHDAAADRLPAATDGAAIDGPPSDGTAGAHDSCVTVTLALLGCNTERLAECELEYAQSGSGVATAVDTYAQCVRVNFAWHPSTDWPAGPMDAAACNPIGLGDAWQHGAWQFQAAAVYGAINQITCAGTTTNCADAGAGNCGLQCNWNPATNVCLSIPCADVPLSCMGSPGVRVHTTRGLWEREPAGRFLHGDAVAYSALTSAPRTDRPCRRLAGRLVAHGCVRDSPRASGAKHRGRCAPRRPRAGSSLGCRRR
jgi:hypothetical protein